MADSSALAELLLAGTLIGLPSYFLAKKGLNHMAESTEPLSLRLEKVRLDKDTNNQLSKEGNEQRAAEKRANEEQASLFNSFKQDRLSMEKVAKDGDSKSMGGLSVPALQTMMIYDVAKELGKGVGEVVSPTARTMGTKFRRWAFPSISDYMAYTAAPEEALKNLLTSGASELGKASIGGLTKIVGKILDKHQQSMFESPRRKLILDALRKEDEYINKMNPTQANEAFHTMSQVAPTLSTDKNAVKSFLRSVASFPEGGIDWNTMKGLADAEQSILKARQAKSGI